MSFATPEMTGMSQKIAANATNVTMNGLPPTVAQKQGVQFPVFGRLPMHQSMQNMFSAHAYNNSIDAKHGIEISSYQIDQEPAPVTMKFNTSADLANILFPSSESFKNKQVNLQHVHEGMLNHTAAINTLASSMKESHLNSHALHKKLSSEMDGNHSVFHTALENHTDVLQKLADKSCAQSQGLDKHKTHIDNLSSEMESNHHIFHTALENHTDVLQQLANNTSAHSQGLLDHKTHIEKTLLALQQQNHELEEHALSLKAQQNTLSSFKTLLNSKLKDGLNTTNSKLEYHAKEQNIHAVALENHMNVLNQHVGTLDSHGTKLEMHSTALVDHRDHIKKANRTLGAHETLMSALKTNIDNLDGGLMHHTEVLQQMNDRQSLSDNQMQSMSRHQAQIMQTQESIHLTLQKLQKCIAKNNAQISELKGTTDSAMNATNDILKIKKAVNENASVLQSLYADIRREPKSRQ
jgi:septal ring factor EnvC (AmiA/AmiB activator)